MATVFERVQRVVADIYSVEKERITLQTHIVHDFAGDSLLQVECVMALEEEFTILFGEETTEYGTVGQIVTYISKQLGVLEDPIAII